MTPRKLPWHTEAARAQAAHQSVAKPVNRTRDVSPSSDRSISELATAPVRHAPKSRLEEPPSSPNALSALEPVLAPEIAYMDEGFDADDIFMMVEDELYSTAQSFTRHLHHEEYIRREKLARSRIEEAVDGTDRRADGITKQTISVKGKLNAFARTTSIRQETKEHIERDDRPRDTHLSSLVPKDTLASIDLSVLVQKKVKTKAAAGIRQGAENNVSRAQSKGRDEGANSLDGLEERQPLLASILNDLEDTKKEETDELGDMASGLSTTSTKSQPPGELAKSPSTSDLHSTPFDLDILLADRSQQRAATTDFLAKRKAALAKKRQSQAGV